MDINVPRTQLVFHAEEQTFLVQKTISYTWFFLDNKVSGWGGWEREGLAGRQTLALLLVSAVNANEYNLIVYPKSSSSVKS